MHFAAHIAAHLDEKNFNVYAGFLDFSMSLAKNLRHL
jgi:hypothetical protein